MSSNLIMGGVIVAILGFLFVVFVQPECRSISGRTVCITQPFQAR